MSTPTPPQVTAANMWQTYMKAWRHGAGAKPLDPVFTHHDNSAIVHAYLDGYKAGREAAGAAAQLAGERFGYVPTILRLQETK